MKNNIEDVLPLTVDSNGFDNVFILVNHDFTLDLANENSLNVYHLRTENRKFIYNDLMNFCTGNIIQYIFNRNVVKQAKTIADIQRLYNQGKKKFREMKNVEDKGAGGELGELLLYLLLETQLSAPKLLSKMELKTTGNQYIYGADGVHLYMTKDCNGKPVYQFIIGEAKIKNDILDATRVAFDSIKSSINEVDIETGLISSEILKEVCTKADAEQIRQMIIPSEDSSNKYGTYEKAIGIFIGYTGNYEEDISNSAWNNKLEEKIKVDIERAVKTMKKKISDMELKGYSFYCYFIPFNNAEVDRREILSNIL